MIFVLSLGVTLNLLSIGDLTKIFPIYGNYIRVVYHTNTNFIFIVKQSTVVYGNICLNIASMVGDRCVISIVNLLCLKPP